MAAILPFSALIIWLCDICTDGLTVVRYWEGFPITIVLPATIFFSIGGLAAAGVIVWALPKIIRREEFPQDTMTVLISAGATFQSVPQLMINLFALSSCDSEKYLVQYISAGCSGIGISLGLLCASNKTRNGDSAGDMNWVGDVLIYLTKALAAMSRILILVYFSFYLGSRTSLFLAIHTIILILYGSYQMYGSEMILPVPRNLSLYPVGLISLLFWSQLVWFVDESKKWSTLKLSLFYAAENVILLAIGSYFSQHEAPYCLYGHVFILHISFNLSSVIFAFLYSMTSRFSIGPHQPRVISAHVPIMHVNGNCHDEPYEGTDER